jgi:hypothetical protein
MSVDQRCVGPRSALSAEFEEMGAIIRKGFRIEFDLDADHRSCFDLNDSESSPGFAGVAVRV